jgi:hypothetical protein
VKSRLLAMSLATGLAFASPSLHAMSSGGGAAAGVGAHTGVGVGISPGLAPMGLASDAWRPLPGTRQQNTAEVELRACENESREDVAIEKCMAARGYRRAR